MASTRAGGVSLGKMGLSAPLVTHRARRSRSTYAPDACRRGAGRVSPRAGMALRSGFPPGA